MEIKFLNLRVQSPATKSGEYKLNDIIEVKDDNNETYYRIYLNNEDSYAEVPADLSMLPELKSMTWTLDNKVKNSKVVRCITGNIQLQEILDKYGYEGVRYEVLDNFLNPIPENLYREKRLEYRE